MVGEGVLHEALLHPDVESVLVVTRKPSGVSHAKLKEIIIPNFFDLSSIESELAGYNACFFCLGVTSIGKKEDEYRKLTYDLTMNFAKAVSKQNSDMAFCYISGAGTDSTEKGKLMWARVKGKTENDLMKLPFKKVFAFRPGFIEPTKGLKNTLKIYKYVSLAIPLFRFLFPSSVVSLKEIGLAMINVASNGNAKPVLEVKDIVTAAK